MSQADTEALLASHLTTHGVVIERGVELQDFAENASGVTCTLRFQDGRAERVRTKYLVGCDGAHSTVRKGAGIAFEGDAYLQDFMLGNVEADSSAGAALAPNSIQPFVTGAGIAVFFPLAIQPRGGSSQCRALRLRVHGARRATWRSRYRFRSSLQNSRPR